jgi:hypothetical protein
LGNGGTIPAPPPPPPPHFYASTTDHINALNSFFRNPGSCRGNINLSGSANTQIIPGVNLGHNNVINAGSNNGGGGGKRNNNGGTAPTKANLKHSQGKLPHHTIATKPLGPIAAGSGVESAERSVRTDNK